MPYQIGVITQVPTEPDKLWWNLATPFDLYQVAEEMGAESQQEQVRPVPVEVLIQLRQPVFNVGEILVLDTFGREIGSPGRKPSKWGVECEYFDTLEEAVKRAREVFQESLREQAAKDDS